MERGGGCHVGVADCFIYSCAHARTYYLSNDFPAILS